jgi:two-component system OmpR family response regulator
MSRGPLVLIVDDDAHIREVIRFALAREGFETLEAPDGKRALELFESRKPALLVLDILMPEMDGAEVCRAVRARSDVPIIFLSSKDEEVDRVVGLELGGDDYVTKPFSPRELVARVRAVLRRPPIERRDQPVEAAGRMTHGELTLDLDRHQAFWGRHELALTVTEFGLLRTLLRYPGKVYTRDELMHGAYDQATLVTGRTIDSHIRRLRGKLADAGADPIETVHGVGYKLGEGDPEDA